MFEFIQNYWIWIILAGGMFLMHRLGIGCCGGHSHHQGRGQNDVPKAEAGPEGAKAAPGQEPEVLMNRPKPWP